MNGTRTAAHAGTAHSKICHSCIPRAPAADLTLLLRAACTGSPPASPAHGTFNCPFTRHGDVCTAVCSEGFDGVVTSACSYGTFSAISGACTASSASTMLLAMHAAARVHRHARLKTQPAWLLLCAACCRRLHCQSCAHRKWRLAVRPRNRQRHQLRCCMLRGLHGLADGTVPDGRLSGRGRPALR